MSPLEIVAAACIVAVTVGLVSLLFAMRRAVARAEAVLGILDQELRPLVADIRALADETRRLTREAAHGVAEVGVATERVNRILGAVAGVAGAVSTLSRVGQYMSLAMGVRKGVDVFVQRMRQGQGDHHGH